jgi:hypothetical protein
MLRSSSATLAKTVNMKRPMSGRCVNLQVQNFKRCALGFDALLDGKRVHNGTRQPVKLRDHKHVTLDVIQHRFKLRPVSVHAGKLFAEYLFDAGRLQIALLRLAGA